jgi:imidazolonepropionase-like amidohydrolase
MATRDAAGVAKINTGMVAAGKSADFIVLDANPIANTRRINKVYLRGWLLMSREVAVTTRRHTFLRQRSGKC